MRRMLLVAVGALVAVVVAGAVLVGTIRQGVLPPPQGALDIGPLTVMAMRPCPQAWPPLGWNRACGNDQPWTVQAIVHWPGGEVWQGEVLRLHISN